MTTSTPWERIGSASERTWLISALALLALIIAVDLATPQVSLAGAVVLVPLFASIRLAPRTVAGLGAVAVVVAVFSWIWTSAGGAQHLVRIAVVLAGAVLAYVIALARTRVERERMLEGLLEQLVASTASPPGELVVLVAQALVPEFADGARVILQPAGGRARLIGRAGADLPADRSDDEFPGGPVVHAVGTGQTLFGPLAVGARRVGEVRLYRETGRFGGEDLALFDRLADRVALALENSLLLADSQELTRRLDDEHRWLQTVVDQMPSAVTIRDVEGGELVRNQRAEEIQRRAAGDGDAETWFRTHPGRRTDGQATAPGDWPYIRALNDGEVITGEEYQFERHDGTWGVVRVSSAPIRDERDRIVAAVSVFDDTTDQHRDQRALRWLAEVGRLLDRPHTVETRIEEILKLLVAELADAGLIYLSRPDGTLHLRRVVVGDDGDESLLTLPERERSSAGDHPAVLCASSRSTLEIVRSAPGSGGGDWLAEHGFASALFLPIIHAQHIYGCLALATAGPGTQDPRDVKVLELIARRIALALENSQLYAEQHRVATALQRDLLPGALPDWPGLELATLHRPARGAADVGGDFFDLFDAGDERMLIVGDVSGKGVEAAATTALVRHAVRVAARSEQPAPGRIATVNEAVLEDAPGDQFCTLAWAALRHAGSAVVGEVACAGHPQPFLVRAGGGVEPVAATGTLLGFFPDLRSSAAQVRLGPGDALVLFTDGVTEARLPDGSLFGADRVRDALAAAGDRTADGLLDALEDALERARAEARDDVAVVIGRVSA